MCLCSEGSAERHVEPNSPAPFAHQLVAEIGTGVAHLRQINVAERMHGSPGLQLHNGRPG